TTVGVDQSLLGGIVVVSASVFHRELDDLIETVPDPDSGLFLAANVGDAEVDGVEAALDVEIVSGVRFGGDYTYLDVEGEDSARVRRPRHSGTVHLVLDRADVVQPGDRVSVDARVALVGARPDFDPAAFFEVRRNSGYQRADLAVSYAHPSPRGPVDRLVTFARVENLFDRDYEETLGFAARPVNVLAGFRGEF